MPARTGGPSTSPYLGRRRRARRRRGRLVEALDGDGELVGHGAEDGELVPHAAGLAVELQLQRECGRALVGRALADDARNARLQRGPAAAVRRAQQHDAAGAVGQEALRIPGAARDDDGLRNGVSCGGPTRRALWGRRVRFCRSARRCRGTQTLSTGRGSGQSPDQVSRRPGGGERGARSRCFACARRAGSRAGGRPGRG